MPLRRGRRRASWTHLASAPCDCETALKPIAINEQEFVVVSEVNQLYKYNIEDGTWKCWLDISKQCKNYVHAMCLHRPQKAIYLLFDRQNDSDRLLSKTMIKIQIDTQEVTLERLKQTVPRDGCFLSMQHKLHYIGGTHSNVHYVLNEESKEFLPFHEFDHVGSRTGVTGHNVIRFVKSKSALLIGGHSDGSFIRDVFAYCFATHRWQKHASLELQADQYLNEAAYAVTKDERYLIWFDSDINGQSFNYIMDLQTYEIRASKISTPEYPMELGAIVMEHKRERELIVFGYIKDVWQGTAFTQLRAIPVYLTRIIESYFANDKIHLVDNRYSGEEYIGGSYHWVMSVDDFVAKNYRRR